MHFLVFLTLFFCHIHRSFRFWVGWPHACFNLFYGSVRWPHPGINESEMFRYQDSGADYFAIRDKERMVKGAVRRLETLGYTVTVEPPSPQLEVSS